MLSSYRGSTIVPIIITILLVVTAAVMAAFFLWPAPEPKILITNVSPIPRNGERVLAKDEIVLRWEAVYERTRHGLMAEVFVGRDRNSLVKVAQDVEGSIASQSEGIFAFSVRYPVEPHAQYWWKIRVYTRDGRSAESEVWTFVLMNQFPDKPRLVPPFQNAANVPLKNLMLKWQATDPDGDEITYDVYFGREPRLDERDLLLKNTKEVSVDLTALKRLDYSTKYYWKVVARDPFGAESTSNTESFTTQIRAELPALTPSNPRSGTPNFDPDTGKLSWNTSLPLDYYPDLLYFDIYLAEGQSRASLIGTTNVSEVPIQPLKGHTSFTWYVVVRDTAGKEKRSEQWTFSTANRPPVIEVKYPDLSNMTASIPVNWTVIDRDGDDVTNEVFFGVLGETPVRIASGRMNSVFLSGLDRTKQYLLTIKARDGHGGEDTQEILLTPGNAPPVITVNKPVEGEVEPSAVTFNWDAFDPDGDSLRYDLFLHSKNDKRSFENIETETLVLRDLFEKDSYSWYVVARDPRGGFTRSETASFSTGERSPEIVTPLWPEPDSTEVALSGTEFSWRIEREPERAKYFFTLASDIEMEDIVLQRTVDQRSIRLSQDLQGNSIYFWRVDLIVDDVVKEGAVWSFKSFNNPPERPAVRSPLNGASEVSTENLTLSWDAVDRDGEITGYTVYLQSVDGEERTFVTEENSVVIDALLPGREYTWWVVVSDDCGKETVGPRWSFRTGNQAPIIRLISPAEMYLEGARPPLVFEWELDDPEGEDLEVSVFLNLAGRDPGVPVASGTNLSSYRVERLDTAEDYVLTVVAKDPGGKEGRISVPFKSHLASLQYRYPVPEGSYFSGRPFEWSYDFPNNGFIFRLYDSKFTPVIRERTDETFFLPVANLVTGESYYWAVSVIDGPKESAGRAVGFVSGAEQSISPVSPEDNASVDSAGTVLTWNIAGSADMIQRLEVFFGEPDRVSPTQLGTSIRSFSTGRLLAGRRYEWYVQLTDNNGNSIRSAVRSFTTIDRPPTISLVEPADRASIAGNSVELRWSASDTDSDTLRYSVFFGEPDNLIQIGQSIASSSILISELEPGSTYSWYVKVTDGTNEVTSTTRSFSTRAQTVVIDNLSPVNGATGVSLEPEFSWRSAPSTGGEFRLFLGISADNLALIGRTGGTSYKFMGAMEHDKTYFWRVDLWSSNRLVASSEVSRFTTEAAPVREEPSDRLVMYAGGKLFVISHTESSGLSAVSTPYQYQGKASPVVNGDLIYLIDEAGRLVTLRSSASGIDSVSSLNTNTSPERLIMAGGYLWILDTKTAASVVRVTLDGSGVPIRSEGVYRDWTTPVDIFVSGDLSRIYLADALSGIKVLQREGSAYVDISSRFAISMSGYARAVVASGDYVFAGEAGIDGGLKLFNPGAATKSSIGRYYIVLKLLISDRILYAITDRGVSIISVTNPSTPVILKDLELSQADQISVSGRIMGVRAANRIIVFDISSPDNPVLLNEYN